MTRIKLTIPPNFTFQCKVPVRITDVNYGGHVGNDAILSLIHEARMQFLKNLGYSEMNFAGTGMIMADVAIEFKGELFYGDELTVWVTASDLSKIGFYIYYKLEQVTTGIPQVIALAKTGMVCFDYKHKKIAKIPEAARIKLER